MSYILEALKKAEQKRSRGELPDLQSVTGSPGTSSPKSGGMLWKRLLVLALLGNILILVFYLSFIRDEPSGQVLAGAVGAAKGKTGEGDHKKGRGSQEEDGPSVLGRPQLPSPSVRNPEKGVVRGAEQKTQQQKEFSRGIREKPDPLPEIEPVTSPGRVLASGELPPAVQSVIPKMTMTLHFFVSNAADRMVRINGRNLREGDGLNEGVKIAEITPQGVVFESAGYRFEVPELMVARR